MGSVFYFLDRLPKKNEYWIQLQTIFENQKVNDSALDGLLNFSSMIIQEMKILEEHVKNLTGVKREQAIFKVVKKIAENDYTSKDFRTSPRVAFVIDSFVTAMIKLAKSHPNELEILSLVEKFKRQEAEGNYFQKVA